MTKNAFMRVRNVSAILLPAVALALTISSPANADVFFYNVSVPTDSLDVNSADGPFTLVASLTDGSGTDDGENTVTLTNFNVVGPPSTISLTDNGALSYDQEAFVTNASPGSLLNFTLSTTNVSDPEDTPDNFSFYIFDNLDDAVPTTDPGSSLFYIDLGGASPTVTTFLGTDPYEGLNVTVTPEAAPVPEPATTVTLAIAFAGLVGLVAFRKRAKAVVR